VAEHVDPRRRVPGGRPHKVTVRLTDDEVARVKAAAEELTEASYLVHAALTGSGGQQARPIPRQQLRAFGALFAGISRDLSWAGSNLNQLTMHINANHELAPTLDAAIAHLRGVLAGVDDLVDFLDPWIRPGRAAGSGGAPADAGDELHEDQADVGETEWEGV
jgi:hypothetical protein